MEEGMKKIKLGMKLKHLRQGLEMPHLEFQYVFILLMRSVLSVFPGSIFPSWKPSETIFKITFWLGYLNSCINPIIYPCFSQEFKRAFQNVLHGSCLRTGVPSANLQGHVTAHCSSPGPTSNVPVTSVQNPVTVSSWTCCRLLSTSSSSIDGLDQVQSAQVQNKSLLKAWCFSVPRKPSSHGSAKALQLSIGISGEPV